MKNGDYVYFDCIVRGEPNLTKGKRYKVSNVDIASSTCGFSFSIYDDIGDYRYCLLRGCAHIDDNNWLIDTKYNETEASIPS